MLPVGSDSLPSFSPDTEYADLMDTVLKLNPPNDPIDRVNWLQILYRDCDSVLAESLFDARMQGRLEEARLAAGLSRKRALALTRAENERRGRQVRWNGL